MPNTSSAKKALRQSEARRIKNLTVKRYTKKVTKHYNRLTSEGNTSEASDHLPTVYKALDKAAKKGVIKKNKASRLKSRMAVKLKALESKQKLQVDSKTK